MFIPSHQYIERAGRSPELGRKGMAGVTVNVTDICMVEKKVSIHTGMAYVTYSIRIYMSHTEDRRIHNINSS